MHTASVLKATLHSPLHSRDGNLDDRAVSTTSVWGDDKWVLDHDRPGALNSSSTIVWTAELADGERLNSQIHREMCDWMKRFAWSLLAEPGHGMPLSPGTMPVLSTGLNFLARWMSANGVSLPRHLTAGVLEAYLSDMQSALSAREDGETYTPQGLSAEDEDAVGISAVWLRLNVVSLLWKQRDVLAEAGIAPIPEEPWSGRSPLALAKRIATKAEGWIKPLPDEVAVPLLNRAHWFLGRPADDILALIDLCHEAFSTPKGNNRGSGQGSTASKLRRRAAARNFQFSSADGLPTPWHQNLGEAGSSSDSIQRVRQLLNYLESACVIVILADTGMRISELCALKAGTGSDGLPTSVRREISSSGLHHLYLVRSLLTKTEETPREVDWVIGLEPIGSAQKPLPVRAIQILEQLYMRYRNSAKYDDLFVSLMSPGLPGNAKSIKRPKHSTISFHIKNFISDWVDLSGLPDTSADGFEENDLIEWKESRGRIITSHQFRKTFANFSLRVDPRLLPAVQSHFHHVSHAMTEKGYWGSNRAQLEPLSSAKAQQIQLMLFGLVTGTSLLGGRMGQQISSNMAEITNRTKGLARADVWREVGKIVDEKQLRMWFSAHGNCLPVNATKMRCHQAAGTRPNFDREPNYSLRDATLCTGCACFVLSPKHKPFWEKRYKEHAIALKSPNAARRDDYRVIQERARQARALLVSIGVDANAIDAELAAGDGEATA